MDKETIRAIALEKYSDSEFRVPNAYCFIEGAEWLQSQSLSERLTEEEKTMIRAMHHESIKAMKELSLPIDYSGTYRVLTQIFGKDFFTCKTKKSRLG